MITIEKKEAILIQRILNFLLHALNLPLLKVDGSLGNKSKEAVKVFQREHGLVQDGIIGPITKKKLDKVIKDKFITEESFVKAAQLLGVTPAHIKAIVEVEAKGSGYFENTELVVLYERHIFYRELKKRMNMVEVEKIAKNNPDICNRLAGGYKGGPIEWSRINKAKTINEEAALLSASYGLGQVMGFNYKLAGYNTVHEMVNTFNKSETNQLLGMVNFIKANPYLVKAIKRGDWATTARLYNGPAFKKNNYDTKLALAFKKHSR